MIIFEKSFEIYPFDADSFGKIKLHSLQNYMQTAATIHSVLLEMKIEGCAWLMYRMVTEIERLPKTGETIKVVTWPLPKSKLRYNRETLYFDANGEVLAKAETYWCIVDLKTNKFLSELHYKTDVPLKTERVFSDYAQKLNPPNQKWEYKRTVNVGFNDIDENNHLNNTVFTKWATDCFERDFYSHRDVKLIQVDFLSQVYEGDKVELYITADSEVWVKGVSNEKEIFMCILKFR